MKLLPAELLPVYQQDILFFIRLVVFYLCFSAFYSLKKNDTSFFFFFVFTDRLSDCSPKNTKVHLQVDQPLHFNARLFGVHENKYRLNLKFISRVSIIFIY